MRCGNFCTPAFAVEVRPAVRSSTLPLGPNARQPDGETKEAAGYNQGASPDQQVVTAAPTETLSLPAGDVNTLSSGVDFQSVRSQTSMQQVLELLEFDPVEARGDQLRGACPVHNSTSPSSRSFSANLSKNTFRCFKCQAQGNHLDLWRRRRIKSSTMRPSIFARRFTSKRHVSPWSNTVTQQEKRNPYPNPLLPQETPKQSRRHHA